MESNFRLDLLPLSFYVEQILRRIEEIEPDRKLREGIARTPERVERSWLTEFCSGYCVHPDSLLKTFSDGAEHYNQIVLVRDIPIYSQCEHHLVPFFGKAHIGYIPDKRIVGLSKLARVADAFARRLQVQERLTAQIADCINACLKPIGVAVVLNCRHLCMEARGIQKPGTSTVTAALHGVFHKDQAARNEFYSMLNLKEEKL